MSSSLNGFNSVCDLSVHRVIAVGLIRNEEVASQ